MYSCPKCGNELNEKAKFCQECGNAISGQSALEAEVSLGGLKTVSVPIPAQGMSLGDLNTVLFRPSVAMPTEKLKGRYVLHEEIGTGGFATVYKGKDIKLGRIVAVKVFQKNNDEAAFKRFKAESSLIASVNHKNIVAVYDSDESDSGIPFIVMEYISGGSLRDRMKEKLSVTEALNLFKGICSGMAYAHRKNLIHRDLKPANIMLQPETNELVPKIVDFGLARGGGSSEVSMTGYGMGTASYMPPEQKRDAKSVNHTADIYALGKMFYEMLSGETADAPDRGLLTDGTDVYWDVIVKATRAKPEDRYFTIDEMLKDIDSAGTSNTGNYASQNNSSMKCAACGTANKEDAKFCVKCGAGLYDICPECGAETLLNIQFCSVCGTDKEGFRTVSGILDKMKKYFEDGKYSRVIKENELVSTSLRLSGAKSRKILGEISVLVQKSQLLEANEDELNQINELQKAGDYSAALEKLKSIYKQNPLIQCELKALLAKLVTSKNNLVIKVNKEKLDALLSAKSYSEAYDWILNSAFDGIEMQDAGPVVCEYKGYIESKRMEISSHFMHLRTQLLKKVIMVLGIVLLLFGGLAYWKKSVAEYEAALNGTAPAIVLEKYANRGDRKAMLRLGNCYRLGEGNLSRDDVKAFGWYMKASENGNIEAMALLGNYYYSGTGVKKDYAEAIKWYTKYIVPR